MARPCKQNERTQRALQDIPEGGRRKEKPRKRWLDDVEDDFRKTGVKRRIKAMDRTDRRKVCEAAKDF